MNKWLEYVRIFLVLLSFFFFLLLFFRWFDMYYHTQKTDDCIDLPQILERKRLDVILSHNSLSYYILHGQVTGFQYELVKKFSEYLNVELHIILNNDIMLSLDALKKQEANIACYEFSIDSNRFCPSIALSIPYGITYSTLVYNKFIQQVNDTTLCDHIVYIPRWSIFRKDYENFCQKFGKKARIFEVPFVSSEHLIDAVASGKILFTIADKHMAKYFKYLYPQLDISKKIGPERGIGWALNSCQKMLLDTLNKWLQKYTKSKEYAYLYYRYFSQPSYKLKATTKYFSAQNGKISPYDDLFKKYAKKYGWDWRLIAALVYEESRFKTDLVSPAGAFGIMQLMPATALKFGADSLSDLETQIKAGIAYMTKLDQQFRIHISDSSERIKFVLASYNIGEGHIFDAMALAKKYNRNPYVWEDNVEYFLLKKSLPQFYNDKVVKSGYCKGNTTKQFVKNVLKHYETYKNIFPN